MDSKNALRGRAYENLRSAILEMKLEPGQVTTDSELSRKLGMSRTPVREALTLLERELLVKRVPNHGVVISEVSTDDLVQLMQLREVLDGLAARLAARTIGAELVQELEGNFKKLEAKRGGISSDLHSVLSSKLHDSIVRASGNRFLINTSQMLKNSFQRAHQFHWKLNRETRDSVELAERRYREHIEIIAALKLRSARRAETAARRHIVNALQDMLRATARRG